MTAFAAEGYGSVSGQFVLEGPAPALPPLVKQGDPAAKDPAVCAKENVPDESLVVDPQTHGLANVFFFMPNAPANIYPALVNSKEKVVYFDQKNCRFLPHAMILRTDQTVAVLSGDPIPHNTHVNNMGENQTIPAGDRSGSTRWNFPLKERYVTQVKCDIHGWMVAWWLIIDHPYATISGKDGKFKIEHVPAGTHEFSAWQESSGWVFGKSRAERVRRVTVEPNKDTSMGVIRIPISAFTKS